MLDEQEFENIYAVFIKLCFNLKKSCDNYHDPFSNIARLEYYKERLKDAEFLFFDKNFETYYNEHFDESEKTKREKNKLIKAKEIYDFINAQEQNTVLEIIKENPSAIFFIDKQTDELCEYALNCFLKITNNKPYNYVNYSGKRGRSLFGSDYNMLSFSELIRNKSADLWNKIVRIMPLSIRFVDDQPYELCEFAVRKNGMSIRHIKNQTAKLCLLAVKQNGMAFIDVNEKFATDSLMISAVKRNGYVIKYIKNQTPELCMRAIKNEPMCIAYIENRTTELWLAAINKNPNVIKEARKDELSDDIILYAIKKSPKSIIYLEKFSDRIVCEIIENEALRERFGKYINTMSRYFHKFREQSKSISIENIIMLAALFSDSPYFKIILKEKFD